MKLLHLHKIYNLKLIQDCKLNTLLNTHERGGRDYAYWKPVKPREQGGVCYVVCSRSSPVSSGFLGEILILSQHQE